jgi:PAS domain S-box-containing protein
MSARDHIGRDRIGAALGAQPMTGDGAHGAASASEADADRAYVAERRESVAARAPFVYSLLLFFGVIATTIEFFAYPARRQVMLFAFGGYALTCLATIALVRRHRERATELSVLANTLLILLTAGYYAPTHAAAEACAMTLVLFLAALPLVNGAGPAIQALSCLGALIGYSFALIAGAVPQLPTVYGLTAVAGATAVTVLGAYLLDQQRRTAFQGREALRAGEERLREMLERYRALYENNPVMYFTVEADGTVRSVNRFGAEQLGYEVGDLLGRSVMTVFAPEDRADIQMQLERCIAELGNVAHWECRKVRKDGSELWVRESARALRDGDGRIVILIVCEDATERKQAEAAARRHQAALAHVGRLSLMGEMASGLAHELNQPLAAIVNFTRGCERRLRASGAADPDMLDALEQVSSQALRAGEIIRSIRQFVRKEDSNLAWVDVNDLVRTVAQLADPEGRQQGVRIQLALTPSLPKVCVNGIQIEQVILNLMRNGFDAMEDESLSEKTLSIHTAAPGEARVEVAISDTGTGLRGDLVDRIFDPFFSTKPSGLGLGLSISRSIVEAHGGKLWVEDNPGGGSTFRFSIGTGAAAGSMSLR